MFGYIYLVTCIANGKRYIGKRASSAFDPDYLGSGRLIRRAVSRHGRAAFRVEVLRWAATSTDLDELERQIIREHNAVADPTYYNMADGGSGGNTWASMPPEVRSEKFRKMWAELSEQAREARNRKVAAALKGRSKSSESRRKMSMTKTGKPRNWSTEVAERVLEAHRAALRAGTRKMPKGNAGNRAFKHSDETVAMLREQARARHRAAKQGRGSYRTTEGVNSWKEGVSRYYTDERRIEHGRRVSEGIKRADRPKRSWYHDPADPTQRTLIGPHLTPPEGWVPGKGATGPCSRKA